MTVKKLRTMLKGIPDDAKVVVSAEYGDNNELANHLIITRDNLSNDMCGVIFEHKGWESIYDEDSVREYPRHGKVTGVLISSY